MFAVNDASSLDLTSIFAAMGTGGTIAAALLFIHRDMTHRVLPHVARTFRRDIRRDRRILLRSIMEIPQQCQATKRRPPRKAKPRETKPRAKPKKRRRVKKDGPDLAKCRSGPSSSPLPCQSSSEVN